MARHYAITDVAEARAYLAHPILGPRLVTAVQTLIDVPEASAEAILGGIDSIKLRSSMTLFAHITDDTPIGAAPFEAALVRFFAGERDPETIRRL